jgi:hypothetical protein
MLLLLASLLTELRLVIACARTRPIVCRRAQPLAGIILVCAADKAGASVGHAPTDPACRTGMSARGFSQKRCEDRNGQYFHAAPPKDFTVVLLSQRSQISYPF